ncbi:hypothetical protein [Knoellia koreensis]|uniref:Uncharacterized protein n=1 Tax=Knoellia koreensis TaxID=2730921 RepID=A0A849HD60_9MICO|nr:hypothetical protein [Knoellia sp. DB2414S]NNM45865.1 hypothetical protein [Knoellia sp. DB2414S]
MSEERWTSGDRWPPMGDRRAVPPRDLDFSQALSWALERRGWSLAGLRDRLAARGTPVSVATLSYWRSGRSQPERATSLDALAEVEDLLALRHGELSDRLGPSRRVPPSRIPPFAGRVDVQPLLEAALADVGCPLPQPLTEESVQHLLELDAEGIPRTLAFRQVIRAMADNVAAMPTMVVAQEPAGDDATFHVVAGGHLGREVHRREDGIFVAEVVFDRPLERGETTIVEVRIDLPRDLSNDEFYEAYAVRRAGEVMVCVRFHPDRMPATVQRYRVVDSVTISEDESPVRSTSHVYLAQDFGPGALGIRWRW